MSSPTRSSGDALLLLAALEEAVACGRGRAAAWIVTGGGLTKVGGSVLAVRNKVR